MKPEKNKNISRIAAELMSLTRRRLSAELRHISPAILALHPIPGEISLQTSGTLLFYSPAFIICEYRKDRRMLFRDYLHCMFHCLFRHQSRSRDHIRKYWDLACDIAVESVLDGFAPDILGTTEPEKKKILTELRKLLRSLSADNIYFELIARELTEDRLEELKSLFLIDDHQLWYNSPDIDAIEEALSLENTVNVLKEDDFFLEQEDADETWKDIARDVKAKIDFTVKEYGDGTSHQITDPEEITQEHYNYADFLKRMAVPTEAMGMNDAEFDYIFYTYGLQLYGDMPLVEPLEYKETKKVRELVIAIDTSESTKGDQVKAFLNKTCSILQSRDNFSSRFTLYIIQCDSVIEDVVRITNQGDIERYIDNMKIYGLGGTDFRPVFHYVDDLLSNGKFHDLKGLIYFTDGHGRFPDYKPAYDAAFVFIREYYDNPPLPPWAIRVIMEEGDE